MYEFVTENAMYDTMEMSHFSGRDWLFNLLNLFCYYYFLLINTLFLLKENKKSAHVPGPHK